MGWLCAGNKLIQGFGSRHEVIGLEEEVSLRPYTSIHSMPRDESSGRDDGDVAHAARTFGVWEA